MNHQHHGPLEKYCCSCRSADTDPMRAARLRYRFIRIATDRVLIRHPSVAIAKKEKNKVRIVSITSSGSGRVVDYNLILCDRDAVESNYGSELLSSRHVAITMTPFSIYAPERIIAVGVTIVHDRILKPILHNCCNGHGSGHGHVHVQNIFIWNVC